MQITKKYNKLLLKRQSIIKKNIYIINKNKSYNLLKQIYIIK
jgi:hypothetical protein